MSIANRSRGLNLGKAIAEEPDAVDEQTIGGTLDLKVTEEGVGAEEGNHFIENVVALAVRVGRFVCGERRVGDGEGVCWAASLCSERQEGEVADEVRRIGVGVEDGIVGLSIGESKVGSEGEITSYRHLDGVDNGLL